MGSADRQDLRPDEMRITGGRLLVISIVILVAIGAIGALTMWLVPAPADRPSIAEAIPGDRSTREFYGRPR